MVKSLTTGLALMGILGLAPAFADWDDPPIVNTVQPAIGNLTLNFAQRGVHQQIGLFLVNSNDPDGFHVDFTFANKGYFTVGTRQIEMTNVVLSKVSGTLGTGLTEANNTSLTIDAGTGVATWNPGVTPTGATENYLVAIYADWADASAMLAGYYMENITAVIVSGP